MINQVKMKGEYRFTIKSAAGVILRETDWMDNLITNYGKDQIGLGVALGAYCRIGTGNTTPAVTDTQLVSQSASTGNTVGTPTAVNNGTPNYETVYTVTYEFALGAVVGNMAEIGIGTAASGATLASRALIVNSGGTPTTITVLSSEILDVTYRFTLYPKLTDSTGSVTISGTAYSYTARATNIATVLSTNPQGALLSAINGSNAYNGAIGATTGYPAGTATPLTAGSFLTYTAGNYYRDFTISAALSVGNLSGVITAITTNLGNGGVVFQSQIGFGTAIPKDNTKVLNLTFRQAWH